MSSFIFNEFKKRFLNGEVENNGTKWFFRPVKKDFIENLKKYRKKKGLSQAQLAEFCNISTGTIGNIECGIAKPSFDLILTISEILDIHPALLFASEQIFLMNITNTDAYESLLKIKAIINSYFK